MKNSSIETPPDFFSRWDRQKLERLKQFRGFVDSGKVKNWQSVGGIKFIAHSDNLGYGKDVSQLNPIQKFYRKRGCLKTRVFGQSLFYFSSFASDTPRRLSEWTLNRGGFHCDLGYGLKGNSTAPKRLKEVITAKFW